MPPASLQRTLRPYDALRLAAHDFTNPRRRRGLDEESIAELAVSIVINGLQSPLLVRPDGTVLGGQRRYLAIGMIRDRPDLVLHYADDTDLSILDVTFRGQDLADVPVVIAAGDEMSDRARALVDNIREDLTSYELAIEVAALVAAGESGAAVARTIGKSKSYISKMLKAWAGAGEGLRECWRLERIPYDRVKELAELPPAEQIAAVSAELAGEPVHRGTHGRPGITRIRALLEEATAANRPQPHPHDLPIECGALAALRYAAGMMSEDQLRASLGWPIPVSRNET